MRNMAAEVATTRGRTGCRKGSTSRTCRRSAHTITALSALWFAPGIAQQPPEVPASEALRDRYVELAGIRAHVFELLDRVFEENPALVERHRSILRARAEAMAELDPRTPMRRERLRGLEAAYVRALRQNDETAARALVPEAEELYGSLQATAAEAARRPDLARDLESLRDDVVSRLSELDPDAVRLLERAEALSDSLLTATVEGWTP